MHKFTLFTVLLISSLVFAVGPDEEQLDKIDQAITDDTPVELPDMRTEKEIPKGEIWTKPDYSNQQHALGYSEGVFSVPKSLEERFNFWLQIYTRYTSEQGVLHDSKYINLIYREVDFMSLVSDSNINPFLKSKMKSKMVKEAKKEIKAALMRLHDLSRKGPPAMDKLTAEEVDLWKKFENINEPNKFLNAARNGRLRFQLGQKDRIQLGILYSGRYIKKMEKIFRDENLPVELTRLPFVESSFNIFARSKAAASGIWQFMPRTGRQYMKVNRLIDERNDPIVATKAAVKLMKLNYKILETWPLAVTAYNQGAGGLLRMSNKLKTKDLSEIIDKGTHSRFGFAGENFYTCFITMLHVEANADKYFGPVQRAPELKYEIVTLPSSVDWKEFVSWFGNDEDMAKLFNPHINTRGKRKNFELMRGVDVRIPLEKKETAMAAIESLGKKSSHVVAKKSFEKESSEESVYTVKSGDTLYDISRELGVPLQNLMDANDIDSPSRIKPGLKLVIP